MANEIEMTEAEQISFLVSAVKSYQHLFLAIEPKIKFYPALKKDMAVVQNVEERVARYMEAYHKKYGKQYFPAVNGNNRNN